RRRSTRAIRARSIGCIAPSSGRAVAAARWSAKPRRTQTDVSVQNRRAKRALLEGGYAHGILVYADGEGGWCQYGTSDELIARKGAPRPQERTWRITCFVVDRRFRRQGVAQEPSTRPLSRSAAKAVDWWRPFRLCAGQWVQMAPLGQLKWP